MSQPTRLFDCLQLFLESPVPDQLSAKVNGAWKRLSSVQVNDQALTLSAALYKHGISVHDGTTEGRDKVGIISASRPEWIITDLAVQQAGAILVPVYPNTHVEQLKEMYNEAAVKIVFADTKERYDLITALLPEIPSIEAVYIFDEVEGYPSCAQLMKEATEADVVKVKQVAARVRPEDVTTIIYTSGTTGRPKGVMLTHKNILCNVKGCESVLNQIPLHRKKALSFLPLNHIFEKMITYVYLFNGFSIYYAENMDTIGANLKEVKPTLFVSVPRLLEKVYERIMAEGEKLTGLKKAIFYWAVSLAERFRLEQGGTQWYRLQMYIADKLVFSKWRAAIGGRVGAIVVGGAACQVRLERLFCAAGIPIMEGYGLTETSPVVAVNDYAWENRMFGTVGSVIKDVKIKIDRDGEILVKGPNVMVGYYKNPELTAEVLTDGWFHTGDIGEFVANRFLKITDRKKEIFKTSGGKFVAPLPIENKMKENALIEQMMVIGPGRKFVAALIVPSFISLKAWCEKQGIPYTNAATAVKDPRVIKLFQSLITQYNPGFNHVEQVKKFTLLPQEWTIENGELTPKLSLRRKVIMDHYEQEIEELYHDEHELNTTELQR